MTFLRRLNLGLIIFSLFALTGRAEVTLAVRDRLDPLPAGAVRLDGVMGAALQTSVQGRLTHPDVEEMLRPFRERKDVEEWRAEFWGKWITAAIPAWQATGDEELHAVIERAVAGLLATQTADGYIGAHPDGGRLQRWDLWGRKYTLLGLLAWYDATGDAAVLAAAQRHADRVLEEVGPGKASPFTNDMWNGLASGSILEPMLLLYRRTGERRYLDFAQYLVASWPQADGPDLLNKALAHTPVFAMFPGPVAGGKGYMAHGLSKSYEMMSNFEGLTELYRVTGDARYGEAVKWVHGNIRDTEITVIGSGSDWERWNDGARRQTAPWAMGMETCVTSTWMKFSAQLLRLTGEPGYVDEIECAAYNALIGAQGLDGRWWAHHMPLAGTKEHAPDQCGIHQNCCVASGPRGLVVLPRVAVMSRREGPVVNLYGAMRATAPLADGTSVEFVQKTNYPRDGDVELTVTPAAAQRFSLGLRIPAWSERTIVTVNGKAVRSVKPGRYLELKRRWQPGDVVRLQFDFRPRVIAAPGDPSHVAIMRGPLVLARDARLSPGQVDQPVALAPGQAVTLTAVKSPVANIAEVFTVAGTELTLCDFASAGNTWTEASRYRVWLPRATERK